MTTLDLNDLSADALRSPARPFLGRLLAWLRAMRQRRRDAARHRRAMRELAALSPHLLRDIGFTVDDQTVPLVRHRTLVAQPQLRDAGYPRY